LRQHVEQKGRIAFRVKAALSVWEKNGPEQESLRPKTL
jgi:hypothetical protein